MANKPVPKGPPAPQAPKPATVLPQITVTVAKGARSKEIAEIEKLRGSRVITYVTALRPDLGAKMATDTIPVFYEHLKSLGHQKRLDLFLITGGGDTVAAPRLAFLLRDFTDHLGVLVPRHSKSAGTSLALAADEVVMHPMGELGPIDPSVGTPFNPLDPNDPNGKRRLEVSVEDVSAFLKLAKDLGSVPDDRMADVVGRLSDALSPLALGTIYRQYLLIRTMGERLLATHLDREKDGDRIRHILDMLTEKFYFHGYSISRAEARDDVGLDVVYPDSKLEAAIWSLYERYRTDLRLEVPALQIPNVQGTSPVMVDSAVIESGDRLHTFTQRGEVRVTVSPNKPPDVNVQTGGEWREHK